MKQEFKIISSLIEKNSKILDVGCGNGELMKYILENISKELNVSQYLIANKKDLENHFGENKVKINGWRKKIFEDIKAKTKE